MFKPFLFSFIISLALTPLVRFLALTLGFVDDPARDHPGVLHQKVIPRAGGVAMFIAFAMTALIFAQQDRLLTGILLGGGLNVLVGTLDDKYDLSPILRLFFFQPLATLIVIAAGLTIFMTNPFGEGILYFDQLKIPIDMLGWNALILPADLILGFWIIWMMNVINLSSKGVSQVSGIAVIAFLVLAGVALKYQAGNPYQMQTALLAVISAGAVLAFLPFNFPPEKIFPGFGATTWIGFNLAVLAVLSGGKLATAILVLAVPTIDTFITIFRRLKNGQAPWFGDRGHLYHHLLDVGLSKRGVILFYWLVTAILGLIAYNFESQGKLFSLAAAAVLVVALFVTLVKLTHTTLSPRD